MKFLDIAGLRKFLALLLTKVVAAINEVANKVTNIEGDYLSKSNGGTIDGTLKTDDVQVGKWQNGLPVEDIDPSTNQNRAAGSLRVNGTTELFGEIKTHGQSVDFGDVNVSGKITAGNGVFDDMDIYGDLDMHGYNINNVQSITVSGTVRGNTYKAPKLDATDVSGTRIGKATEPYADAYITNIHGALDGNADSADKLNTSAGSVTKPIYFNGGKPVACTHELNATVPSNAKFTDTVYTHPNTSGNKHIPSGGKSGQILRWSADGTAAWGADNMADFVELTAAQLTDLTT